MRDTFYWVSHEVKQLVLGTHIQLCHDPGISPMVETDK